MTDDRIAAIRANADVADRIFLPHLSYEAQREIDRARKQSVADVRFLLAEVERLTHLLGSHADGHLCTCTMLTAATPWEPSEWEQDPWCPTHPNMTIVLAERDANRAALDAVLGLCAKADADSRWQPVLADEIRAAITDATT